MMINNGRNLLWNFIGYAINGVMWISLRKPIPNDMTYYFIVNIDAFAASYVI